MKKTIINSLTICTLFFATAVNAQVGVGVPAENIHPSAELEVKSTTKGFLPPRMTKAERDAIVSPATGLLIYQTDGDANNTTIGNNAFNGTTNLQSIVIPSSPGLYYYDGTAWKNVIGAQGATGAKGDKGETGAVGAQGIQGEDGIQGIKGETGAIGAQGIQGIQGEIGLQGLQGQQGLQGATGLKGDKGETGPQGPQSTNDYLFMPSNMSQGGQVSMLANSYYKMEIAPVDFTFSQITYFKLNTIFTNLSFGIYSSNGLLLATVTNTISTIAGLNTATFNNPVSLKKGEVFYLGYSSYVNTSTLIFGIALSSSNIPSSVYGFASYWVNGQCPITMPTMTGTASVIPWYCLI